MAATAQQLLDATNDAILALTEAIAENRGVVEYYVLSRRVRTTDPALALATLTKQRDTLMRQLSGGRRPVVRVASLSRPTGSDR